MTDEPTINSELKVGDRISYQRFNNTIGRGTITEVFERHWQFKRPAYHVQGNAENLTVHDFQILEVL